MARGFKIADAYVDIHADRDSLKREIGQLPAQLGPDGDRAGRGIGDKVSQGLRQSFVRNSPLIVAALAGGLAAGGPVMTTAAVGLFATIGIVAAAQSQRVQSTWLGTWSAIKAGAIADAAPIEATLTGLAGRVSSRFQDMRPILRDIFGDAAPQIEVFASGLLGLADNALPGFQRAIAASMPVTQGFADFLESVGTGLTGFFDAVTEHAPAAGQVWRELGETMETLLPILGELMGQGAELATMVLPLLNGSLGAVLGVLDALGPALPYVVAGFAAFKLLGPLTGVVNRFSSALTTVQVAATGVTGPISNVHTGMNLLRGGAAGLVGLMGGPWGLALAAAGVAVMAISSQMQSADEQTRTWTEALIEGGSAADRAREEYERVREQHGGGWMADLDEWAGFIGSMEDAEKAAAEYLTTLSPLERAQAQAKQAQNELTDALDRYGPTSRQVADAQANLSNAQREVTQAAEAEARAIRGVTEAMIEQIDQSRAMVDAAFAHEDALNDVADKTKAYADAVREFGRNSPEAIAALDELERGYRKVGDAASNEAMGRLPASLDDQTRALMGARAELGYYRELLAKGIDLPPELDEHVALLERQAGGALNAAQAQDILSAAISDLGVAVNEVPGEKAVTIRGEGTEDLRAKLESLGFAIERIPGTTDYKIIADDEQSEAALGNLMAELATVDTTVATPTVEITGVETFGTDIATMEALVLGMDGIVASPEIQAQSNVRTQTEFDLADLFSLGGTVAKPQADMQTDVPETTTRDLGLLGHLGGQRPTPTADLNDQPLQGVIGMDLGMLGNLANQRPTPTSDLDNGPLYGSLGAANGALSGLGGRHVYPQATVQAHTSAAEAAINAVARARTSILNVVQRIIPGGATGGQVGAVVRGFAEGGSPYRQANGRLRGPGGPLDDLIPAITNVGEFIRVANDEWIINGRVSAAQGEARMAALNAGLADIVPRVRAAAGSGRSMPLAGGPATTTLTVGQVHVHLTGMFDFTKPTEMRRFGVKLQAVLDDIAREAR